MIFLRNNFTNNNAHLHTRHHGYVNIDGKQFTNNFYTTGLHSATTRHTNGTPIVKSSLLNIKKLQTRYLSQPPTSKTDWPMHHVTQYVKLALVKKEDVTIRDENLNEITKLSLQGEVDKILKKKEPLGDLEDIFNKPCPRLILLVGAPGE